MRVRGLSLCLGIGMIALLQSNGVWAKSVGDYSVQVNVSNQVGGGWNDFLTALSGWTCSSSTSASFSETLRNNHGVEKSTQRNEHSNFNMFTDASVDLKFQRDMDAPNPNVGIQVSENCNKTVHNYSNKCDDVCDATNKNGDCTSSHQDCHQVDNPEYKSAYMNWDCSVRVEPTEQGRSQHSECKPAGNNFSSFDLESLALTLLKKKQFTADLTLTNKHDDYVRNYCSPGDTNRVIVQLTQGVGGNALQHDFVFHFNVEGHTFDIENKDGVLDYEVGLCGAGDKISVSATATAKNTVFPDSQYASDDSSGDSISVGRKSPNNWGEIHLRRHAFLGNWTTNPSNYIMVVVKDQSTKDDAQPHLAAAASAASALAAINLPEIPMLEQPGNYNGAAKNRSEAATYSQRQSTSASGGE